MDSSKILESIEKLRQLTQISVQSNWRYCETDADISPLDAALWENWPLAELNAKGHIAWPAGRRVLWAMQRLTVQSDLQGYPLEGLTLRLAIAWWAEDAQIYVNGKLVQQGDLFDFSARVLLSASAKIGEELTVAVRLVSPGHDAGALVRSACVYERTSPPTPPLQGEGSKTPPFPPTPPFPRREGGLGGLGHFPGFIADELAVLREYLSNFEPEKLESAAAAIAEIDWEALPDREKFERSLFLLRQTLIEQATPLKQHRLLLLGHAHLDLAWLWPVSETWEAAQRTFESVLNLQKDFPALIFCHSTPALYEWIEQNRPDLFAAIKKQVAAGSWELVGGMWVEPDLNLISGESIVRQVLYGQRYALEKFGQLMPVAWVPDTFGFCWQLPQILKKGGVDYFVTQKLRWNDTTKFPYGVFWWEAPDGSQIFSFMSALIGESIDPIKMIQYSCEWAKQTGLKDALWLPGVGDHGGGPTRDMLEIAQRWEKSPFFPRLKFSSAIDYLRNVEELATDIPVWKDELYLEFHRGCYTTHADQKRYNRRCEDLLYQAELLASLASMAAGVSYPKADIEAAWKKVLFNQFHDILPGSSIPEVYVDANREWAEAERVSSEILAGAMGAIASQIALPEPPQPDALPVVIFNSLNWARSHVVSVPFPQSPPFQGGAGGDRHWQIIDISGNPLPSQLSDSATLLFLAADIPAVGYRVFWLCPRESETVDAQTSLPDWILENEFLRVTVEADAGNIASIFDKINSREVLQQGGGNQLQAFQDSGQYWDAWNIDPKYAEHPLPSPILKEIQWLEKGEVRSRLRVVRQFGESEFCQDYIIEASSPLLKIVTTVDWRSRHVLVKAAFSLNVEAEFATCEMPAGAMQRPTQPPTPQEKAKWEIPALRWADLSDGKFGASLINDCKYGYDIQPSQLRLTLLRGSEWPDPEADRGFHEFTYALYPHSGSWQEAGTVRRGYELNMPLQVRVMPSVGENRGASLPLVGSFLDLSAQNLILMALKQSEENSDRWILRCYECCGEAAQLELKSDLGLAIARSVDLLERSRNSPIDGETVRISPWEIATFALEVPAA